MPILSSVLMILGYSMEFVGLIIIYLGFELRNEKSIILFSSWLRSMIGPSILMFGLSIIVLWVQLFPEVALR